MNIYGNFSESDICIDVEILYGNENIERTLLKK